MPIALEEMAVKSGPEIRERAAALAERIGVEIEGSAIELPVLPDVCLAVLDVCREEDADAGAIARVLNRDPALTSHVLRVANSAAQGSRVEIANLQQAVSRLGLAQIAEISMTVSLHGRLFDPRQHPTLVKSLWQQAVVSAFAAKGVARHIRRNAENVYLGGLLHDVGHAVGLGVVERVEHERGGLRFADDVVLCALEEHHVQAGIRLAEAWRLPRSVRDAIRHHEIVDDSTSLDTCIVALADRLAGFGLADLRSTTEAQLRADPILERLDLYPEDLEALLEALPGWVSIANEFGG